VPLTRARAAQTPRNSMARRAITRRRSKRSAAASANRRSLSGSRRTTWALPRRHWIRNHASSNATPARSGIEAVISANAPNHQTYPATCIAITANQQRAAPTTASPSGYKARLHGHCFQGQRQEKSVKAQRAPTGWSALHGA
jgi:hypothetical protein